jgi:hypothetical protein
MFCEQCGNKLEDATLFCSSCGAKIKQDAESAEQEKKLVQRMQEVKTKPQGPGYEKAEYDVPHCKFERTANGFRVFYNKPTSAMGCLAAAVMVIGGLVVGIGLGVFLESVIAGFVGLGIMIAIGVAVLKSNPTRIEVTPDAVIIDGSRLNRRDFSHFSVGGVTEKGTQKLGQRNKIGYQYGLRSFSFGGEWPVAQATEIANALNQHLKQIPRTSNEEQTSPDKLRAAANPTDF